ncbi:hypothetical protein PIB30_073242, partial [Stylosanthes scabra]|nr:hypothetical protein [Stylosanthes scabra]
WIQESILNQFSTIHRRLPVAITFDPELRLTHRLRLRGACHLLYASNLGLRIGRARSSLMNLLEILRLMVVLGCSKSGGAMYGTLSVGIQNGYNCELGMLCDYVLIACLMMKNGDA